LASKLVLERIKDNPKWFVEAFRQTIDTELRLICNAHQVWRVKKIAIDMIEANYRDNTGCFGITHPSSKREKIQGAM